MSRPADWSALGLDADPVPGDPGQVSSEAAHLASAAQEITDQIARLRRLAEGTSELKGQFAEKIQSSAADVAGQLGKVVGRYQRVSQALNAWVPELEYAQSQSVQALYAAQDAAAAQQASAPLPPTAGQRETAQQKADDQARARSYAQAGADLATARQKLDAAVAYRDEKAAQATARIRAAIDDGVTDSWWDSFTSFVDEFAGIIKTVCSVLEVIATILAVIALFIPGLDIIVALAIAATALALIGRTMLAATGNGSWTEVAMDAFALLTFGAGRIVGSLAEGAEAASRVAAEGGEEVDLAGKAGDLISRLAESVDDEGTAQEAERQLFRVVGPQEASDIAESLAYRNPEGLEGKYFFPTEEQAVNLASMFSKAGIGGPYTLTSGMAAQSVLDAAEEVNAAGEGLAYFIRNAQLPLITNVIIHGIVP
jgi:division protein CdvB (Snf7/Vps24/ESCRT-III family)